MPLMRSEHRKILSTGKYSIVWADTAGNHSYMGYPGGRLWSSGMALTNWAVWSLVGQRFAERVATLTLPWIASPWRSGLRVSARRTRDLLAFGLSLLGSPMLTFLSRRVDCSLIGLFPGQTMLGFYDVGCRMIRIVVELLSKSIGAVLLPALAKLQRNRSRMRQTFYRGVKLLALITVLTAAILERFGRLCLSVPTGAVVCAITVEPIFPVTMRDLAQTAGSAPPHGAIIKRG